MILSCVTSELHHISGVRTRVQKVKPKMAEFEELKDVNPSPLRGQSGHKNTCTMKIKESTIEIFNFVVFKSMNGTKSTELAALRPLRGLRLTSYSSFNFRHLWLHFTYCSNMRSSYSRYIWSSLCFTNYKLLSDLYNSIGRKVG